jgi:hypothetical protein
MSATWDDLLDGWVPIRFYWEQSVPLVDWCYIGARQFLEPFFNETVQRCLRTPFSLLFRHQTPPDVLGIRHDVRPGIAPTGFIFHMSRCGSTLVSQMLAALPGTVVISEASPIDAILRARFACPSLSDATRIDWLRWMLGALGQPRVGDERHFFVKFDSWNVTELPLIRRAFPEVPWIFLYREPIEVMASQFRRRSAHLVPGVVEPALFGLDDSAATRMQPEEYCAHILARICEATLRHADHSALLVNYTQLPEAVPELLADFFRLDCGETGRASMRERALLDAKNPATPFVGATANTLGRDALLRAAERELLPLYERLETRRLSRLPTYEVRP